MSASASWRCTREPFGVASDYTNRATVPTTERNHDQRDDELLAIRCHLGEPAAFDDLIGAALGGYVTQQTAALAAAGLGLLMLVVAGSMLIRATQRCQQLIRRREELERQLGRSGR